MHALAVSSEAVINTLRIHPEETEELNKLLQSLGCPEGIDYESLRIQSMIQPRESFKNITSNVAKSLVK